MCVCRVLFAGYTNRFAYTNDVYAIDLGICLTLLSLSAYLPLNYVPFICERFFHIYLSLSLSLFLLTRCRGEESAQVGVGAPECTLCTLSRNGSAVQRQNVRRP